MELRKIIGVFGTAEELPHDEPGCEATVFHWLVTAPAFHPLWSQYIVSCVDLRTYLPGTPPVIIDFKGATHEFLILALCPDEGPFIAAKIREYQRPDSPKFGKLPYLTPVNIHQQVIATDDELARLAPSLVEAIVKRGLTPETSDAPQLVRDNWHIILVNGLAHMRGEHEHRGLE